MKRSPLAPLSALAAVTILPGCLAVNAAFGVMGLFGPPAVQLAGAAYAVAEYSYEYSMNDRTPGEVVAAKLEWVFPSEDAPSATQYGSAFRQTVAAGSSRPPAGPLPRTGPAVVAAKAKLRPAAPPVAQGPKPALPTMRPARTAPKAVATASPGAARQPAPHRYVDRAADPLLQRLQRIEQGLRLAETLYLADGDEGLTLSVPTPDGDPCAQGVSGSWSIRHPVMNTVPGPPALPAQSAADSSRSRNT